MDIRQVVTNQLNQIRLDYGYSYATISAELSELLDDPVWVNSVYGWSKGQVPRLETLAALVQAYPEGDWRGDFARAVLRAALGDGS